MRGTQHGFVTRQFLKSVWTPDYRAFRDSPEETALVDRLRRWAARTDLKETSAEAAFLEEFLHRTWGYVPPGRAGAEAAFSLYPQFPVAGGSARTIADAAMGAFSGRHGQVPQVLCEFKGIARGLDAPQKRKGGHRSPVQQGLGHLDAARRALLGAGPTLPAWAIVTDMNEFRLYWADRGSRQYIRFTLRPVDPVQGPSLLDDDDQARFDRFLFHRLFHRDTLLVAGPDGRSPLAQLIAQQRVRERDLENRFYRDYRAFRDRLYGALLEGNPAGSPRFPGSNGRLVRMAQKIIDRCMVILFCEDMGAPARRLRDVLVQTRNDRCFDPQANTIWPRLVSLFQAMNDGSSFGGTSLGPFNGGLFQADPALDQLVIPDKLFWDDDAPTLLSLATSYSYGADRGPAPGGDAGTSLSLDTLGRIFEQSITELEILQAEADGRPSLNKIGKRKRDGVYYTPDWVVERIVAETVGGRLAEAKRQAGWPDPDSGRPPAPEAVAAYQDALRAIRIIDPACGAGAFLIAALRYLLDEWHALRDVRGQVGTDKRTGSPDDHRLVRHILRHNLYGVDINPASVEIAKLALWLHSARGGQPVPSLDHAIRVGNSLIGPDFHTGPAPCREAEKERINAFDWEEAFPQAFKAGGFDVVIGNPPYVKLQTLRKVHADMAAFLKTDHRGQAPYASTQTGNFDLYLPFIEKGIALLNDHGRLGYVAPSVWTVNAYGKGLRDHVLAGRHLYGWIDFQSFQPFKEATTYTALQFFSKRANDAVAIAVAPDGVVPENPFAGNDAALPYDRLAFADRWVMATGAARDLIDRLDRRCRRLDHPRVTRTIFVGLQTSADHIYHLKRLGPHRYLCTPKGPGGPPPREVAIEDAIMKPLVCGGAAQRYVEPATDSHLLFPYTVADGRAMLIPAARMAADYPLAWAYLRSWEDALRSRENGGFDDPDWYRFGRHQNLGKQEIEKLIVPRLVTSVRCSVDRTGVLYLDNVDVGGVAAAPGVSPFWLAGILNSRVCGFVFRHISKPFRGDFRSANRQFIAPLPIPDADDQAMRSLAGRARRLQGLHTQRRDLLDEIGRHLSAVRYRSRPDSWLFPDLVEQTRDARLAALGARLRPGVAMDAAFHDGALTFHVDGAPAIERIHVNDAEGRFILAQWKLLAATFPVTDRTDGRKLANALRRIGETTDSGLIDRIVGLQQRLAAIEADIDREEAAVDRQAYRLYGLTEPEIRLVEAG